MKAAFFLDSPFLSGAEAQVLRNISSLLARGSEVHVFAFSSATFVQELNEKLRNMGLDESETSFRIAPRVRTNKLGELIRQQVVVLAACFWGLRSVRAHSFNFLHVNNGGYPGSPASRGFALGASLSKKVPKVFMSVNNTAVPIRGSPSRIADIAFDIAISKQPITWITASSMAASQLANVLGLARKHVKVIPNGVPAPQCRCGIGEASTSSRSQDASAKAIAVGNLEKRKGHSVMVESVALLKSQGRLPSNWLFQIEGSGVLKESLTLMIDKANLGNQVALLGSVPCIFHAMTTADLLVHPSLSNEDLPNVVSEAMSLALPVVGTSVAGIPEQVQSGLNGLLVSAGDVSELANAVARLMSDKELRVKMGLEGRQLYLSKFQPEMAESRYLEMYGQFTQGEN